METIENIKEIIVNNLGINLCSVSKIEVGKRGDGQLENIVIEFIPNGESDGTHDISVWNNKEK